MIVKLNDRIVFNERAKVSPIITLQGGLLAKFYKDSLAMHLNNENNIHLTPLTIPSYLAM
jgi:hypothetical protein